MFDWFVTLLECSICGLPNRKSAKIPRIFSKIAKKNLKTLPATNADYCKNLFKIALNCTKLLKIVRNRPKLPETAQNCPKSVQNCPKIASQKLSKAAKMFKIFYTTRNCQKTTKNLQKCQTFLNSLTLQIILINKKLLLFLKSPRNRKVFILVKED